MAGGAGWNAACVVAGVVQGAALGRIGFRSRPVRRIGSIRAGAEGKGCEQQGFYDCRARGRGKHTIHSSTLKKLTIILVYSAAVMLVSRRHLADDR
jgi:hypothetical protein